MISMICAIKLVILVVFISESDEAKWFVVQSNKIWLSLYTGNDAYYCINPHQCYCGWKCCQPLYQAPASIEFDQQHTPQTMSLQWLFRCYCCCCCCCCWCYRMVLSVSNLNSKTNPSPIRVSRIWPNWHCVNDMIDPMPVNHLCAVWVKSTNVKAWQSKAIVNRVHYFLKRKTDDNIVKSILSILIGWRFKTQCDENYFAWLLVYAHQTGNLLDHAHASQLAIVLNMSL